MLITPHVAQLIDMALSEDLAGGDVTTDAIFSVHDTCHGELLAKEALVLCGREVFDAVMARVDPKIEVEWIFPDGSEVFEGAELATITGPTVSVLKAERVALNFLQRLCGIATSTRRCVEALVGTRAEIVDTRKTLPGYRLLDKYAVRVGGGRNHRLNLSGGTMIKDNHIAAAGGVVEAIERLQAVAPHTLRIMVEVTCLEELEQAVGAGAEVILLDNMDNDLMATCVTRARELAGQRPVVLEASGNVTLERLPGIAATGVDVISSGALTHTVKAADISLKLKG